MAKLKSEIEVACPCCDAVLVIDVNLRRVVSHTVPERSDKPELNNAARILEAEAARRESLFEQSIEAEKSRDDALAKRFEEAERAAAKVSPIRDRAAALQQGPTTPRLQELVQMADEAKPPLERLTDGLSNVRRTVEDVREELSEVRSSVNFWKYAGPGIVTLILLWVGLGQLSLIARPESIADIIDACGKRFGGIEITALHPRPAESAVRILVTAVKGSRARLVLRAPLVMHEDDSHRFSAFVDDLNNGRAAYPRLGRTRAKGAFGPAAS